MKATKKRINEIMVIRAGHLNAVKLKAYTLKKAISINSAKEIKNEIDARLHHVSVCDRWMEIYSKKIIGHLRSLHSDVIPLHEGHEMPMFVNTLAHTNRQNRRAIENEVKRNRQVLEQIERDFAFDVFNDQSDYKAIYDHYLKCYNDHLSWMKRNRKMKYTAPHEHYFENQYKPE